jgi:hypothetical protein
MENVKPPLQPQNPLIPQLALPDAESARRTVGRWLRTEIGNALYPAEASFVPESFAWHVSVWFSTAAQPMARRLADVYVSAATGSFLGRPSREELAQRLAQASQQE